MSNEEYASNLKVLRPQTDEILPPTCFDIDFHGMRFLMRIEGHPCGFVLKYVHMVPVESMLPPEIREFARQTGTMQILDKDKVHAKPVMERHVHVRPWERRFRGLIDRKVLRKAKGMHKLLVDHLYYDAHAGRLQSVLSDLRKS